MSVVRADDPDPPLGVALHCTGEDGLPERFVHRASSRYAKVRPGPAGGGRRVVMRSKIVRDGRTYWAEIEVFAGLRTTAVLGTVDAFLHDRGGSAVCTDYGIFTARR